MTSYSLEVLLAAMLGGERDGDKPVPARLLIDPIPEEIILVIALI